MTDDITSNQNKQTNNRTNKKTIEQTRGVLLRGTVLSSSSDTRTLAAIAPARRRGPGGEGTSKLLVLLVRR